MTPKTVMLIKILTDIVMTATITIANVNKMTEQQVRDAITSAEQTSDDLTAIIRGH